MRIFTHNSFIRTDIENEPQKYTITSNNLTYQTGQVSDESVEQGRVQVNPLSEGAVLERQRQ